MMSSAKYETMTRVCPICGRALADTAPEGLCLACLLEAGIEDTPEPLELPSETIGSGPAHPRFFGDYEILREVGRGGMGIVYEARQFGTRRTVALKLLSAGVFAGADAVHRFHTEAQAAARLEHPRIVPVYEAGLHDGQHYLAMRFMSGGTLSQWARTQPVDPRRAARIIRSLAEAVAYAHQRGVLHRDLKPGNVLLDETGEPHLADFGLARMAELEGGVTLTSAILGTAAYMPPEQAAGAVPITAGDIYGLGAILYELLTGHPPFTGASIPEILRKVQEEEPVLPLGRRSEVRDRRSELGARKGKGRGQRPRIEDQKSEVRGQWSVVRGHSDLQTICLKCLEKDPARRYATAQDLADELQRFLNDEPILARPVTRLERAVRWCRRKPALATAYGLLLLLVLLLSIASPIAAYRINQSRQLAEAETANSRSILSFLKDDLLVLADPYRVVQPELAPDREIALITAIQQAARRIGSRFENRPLVEAEIRLTIGRALLRLDRLDESKGHLDRAGALYESVNGANSPGALEVRHELGLLLHQQGRHEDAAASHRRVLALRRQVLGPDDLAVLQSLNALAASLSVNASTFDEATALYQEVTERGARALDDDHALVLEAKSGLSRIAYELGHWDESYRLNEELSRIVEGKYGANDPATLRLVAEHIYDLRRIPGKFEESERLREQAIERCRRVLGPDHPTTISLLVDRGYSDQDKGLWGTALQGRRELLNLVQARYGERHAQTLFAQDVLGGTLRRFGDFQEAEAIHRKSVLVRQGLDHKATIAEHRSQRYLVWALFHQGKLEEAEHYQKKVFNGLIEAHGPQMQRVFLSSEKVVKFLGTQGKWREISDIYRELAPLDTTRHSIWPLGLIHLPAGVVAAALAEDEDALRLVSRLMVDRFHAVTDPHVATEIALAFLTVEPHLLPLPEGELLRRLLSIVEVEMATSTRARFVGGLASYRFGDAAQAIERLHPLLPNPASTVASCAGYAVAMAHHRLGHLEAAQRALHDANARLAVGLQSGQLDYKGQDDWDYSVRWAEFGRALVLQHQAETTILGRRISPTVEAQFLKARREEWSPTQALLDEFEQFGRRRAWQPAKAALVQVLESGPLNWDQHGNRVSDLAHKAAVVFAITGDWERYQRLLDQITRIALVDQPYYSLPLLAGLEPQSRLAERIAAGWRTRHQPADVVEVWDRICWGEAEFRAGHPKAALAVLEPALSHHRLEASGIAHAYSALAATAHQLNEQATQFLRTARSKYEQLLADNPERLAQDWHQVAWLEQLISKEQGGL
jgi:eukaryotic-like serine/threonine-protein kinase